MTCRRNMLGVISALVAGTALFPAVSAAQHVEGVSPGMEGRLAVIESRCPSFSWELVPGAAFYELVVYELSQTPGMVPGPDLDEEEWNEVLYTQVAGGGSSWTPAMEGCLVPGGSYSWLVRAVLDPDDGMAGEWSTPRFFSVAAAPSTRQVYEALEVLRRYLEGSAGAGAVDSAIRRGVGPRAAATHRRTDPPTGAGVTALKSVESGVAAIRGVQSDPSGETYGVVGISGSADGAGLGAANLSGGPDLVLDGYADGVSDTLLSQSGIDRFSGVAETFDIGNSGAGQMTLRVEGIDVVTTATDQDTPPRDPGNQLSLAGNALDVVEGAGSGLDADLLDGNEASAFSPDGHTHTGYLSTSGGTLTGALSVQDHLQVTGITYDYFVQEAYGGTYDGSPGGVWVDIVTVPNRLPVLYEVVIVTHDFGWRTGYYVWHAFLGENTSATSINLVSSYEYPETGTPIDPTLRWNGTTLQWEWQVNVCCFMLGPRVTVKAREILGTYDTP